MKIAAFTFNEPNPPYINITENSEGYAVHVRSTASGKLLGPYSSIQLSKEQFEKLMAELGFKK